MKTLLLFASSMLILSCGSSVKMIPMKHRSYDDPPLNTTVASEIGDRLIAKGEEKFQDAVRITSMPGKQFSIQMMSYPYVVGDVLPLAAETKEWYLYSMQTANDPYMMGAARYKGNKNLIKPFVWSTMNGLATKAIEGFATAETNYSDSKCANCFKKEFVFNGRVGNNLKFIYREYINDFARPAFTQELQYDLDESRMIGFKGLRLEVIEASNTSITYKVLNSFNE